MRRSTIPAVMIALAMLVSACGDASPTVADDGARARDPILARLACRTDVAAQTTRCEPLGITSSAARADVILDDTEALVLTSNDSYNAGTQIYSLDAEVQNLMAKAIGTDDGVTPSDNGVRVFFSVEPVVWLGTGMVTVVSADGYDAFTASNQPYHQYVEMIQPNGTSAAKEWHFGVPSTVQGFYWEVLVSAAVAP